MSSSAPVKRACDSCHRRKVKCIGEDNKICKNCRSAGLSCTYNAIPQKKGPKGSRAKVLSELRETQRQGPPTLGYDSGHDSHPHSPVMARTTGLLTTDIINTAVDFYFANAYATQPILHREQLRELALAMDQNIEAYCMMAAFCAAMLIQPNIQLPPGFTPAADSTRSPGLHIGAALLDEAVQIRSGYNHIENPSIVSVITSYYLFNCYYFLDKQDTAWHYLREATTQAVVLGMNDEATYKNSDAISMSKRRRLFWLLFLSERTYAIQKHRPLTLHPSIQLPVVGEDPSEEFPVSGFIHLIKLYRPFDNTFIGLWNRTIPTCVPSWLAQLQKHLNECLPAYLESCEIQAVDLRISQHWLRIMVWQLAISQGYISSASSDDTMSFKYPIEISRDLANMAQQFSHHAMDIHGIGLVEKLFDVACTLADVMACVPLSQSAFEPGPRDYLAQFLSVISRLHGGQNRYVPLLAAKINELLPNTSVALPHSMTATSSPHDGDVFGASNPGSSTGGDPGYESSPGPRSQAISGGLSFQRHHSSGQISFQMHSFHPFASTEVTSSELDGKPDLDSGRFDGVGHPSGVSSA